MVAVTGEKPTQQRVIDNVTISIEPSTPLEIGQTLGLDLLGIRIGESGHGSVLLWLHRSEAPRLIGAIAQAMSLSPDPPKDDDVRPVPAVVDEEAPPF